MRARHGDATPLGALNADAGASQSVANATLYDGKHSGQIMTTSTLPDGEETLPEWCGNWRGIHNRLQMWAIDGT